MAHPTSRHDDSSSRVAFWRALFPHGVPVLEIPSDRARPPVSSGRRATHGFALDLETIDRIVAAGPGGSSRASVVLTALCALLSRYTDQDDLLVARLPSAKDAGSPHGPQLVRLDASGAPRFVTLLGRVLTATSDANAHDVQPLDELLGALGIARSADEPPYRVLFAEGAAPESADPSLAGTDLALCAEVGEDKIACLVSFDTDLFDPDTIERLGGHLGELLTSAAEDPARQIFELTLLTREERQRALFEWNATEIAFPEKACLQELFEARCRENPDDIAVLFRDEALSYGELDRRANRLAHRLRALGVGPDVMTGICVDRSIDSVVGLLGIAKAGGAYVPIDAAYPAQRIEFMLEDTKVPVLLTQSHLARDLPEHSARVILLDRETFSEESDAKPESGVGPHHLSYVIYTSGSTGRPKGVMLDHRGRVNNFTDFNRRYEIGRGDRVLALSSLSFDMSAYDVFGTLAAGATIVMPEPEIRLNPLAWARLMVKRGVTVWHSVPALLEMMVDHAEGRDELRPEALRLVLLGGDWIPLTLPDRIRALGREVHVVSMGGATECSMDSTIYDVGPVEAHWKSIPYGFPMANQRTYVLDRFGYPQPVGVPGELHLGGIGVARGYLNRPELSAEKFVDNPFVDGERMYRTGDLARFRRDGNLELLGRMDFQVKVRGFRVELGEIESACRRHEAIKECVVLARPDKYGDKRLVGYVVPEPGRPVPPRLSQALRRFLTGELPDYMIPSAFVALERFPLTPNGKINRRGLPEPDFDRPDLEQEMVAPRTALETVLADMWSDVLGLDEVGVKDGFAELGGSSLLANQVATRVQEFFQVDVPLTDVYDHDVEELARLVARAGEGTNVDVNAIAEMLIQMTNAGEAAPPEGRSNQ